MLEKGADTFDYIGKYISHFDAITSNNLCTPETGYYFSNLNIILASTFGNAYISPLMHYRERFGEYKITEFFLILDNLLSALWFLNRNISQRIFMIQRKIDDVFEEENDKQAAADRFLNEPVLRYNSDGDNPSANVDLEKLFDYFDNERWGSFSGTKMNKTRYLLLKLDLISSNINSRLYFNKSLSSVEHLMPQTIVDSEWVIDEDEHKNWVHRLGNIILIDRKKNASLSNLSYNKKRNKYKDSIEHRFYTNFIFMNYDHWDIQVIKRNHTRSVQMLKNYYLGNSLKTLKELKNITPQAKLIFTQ